MIKYLFLTFFVIINSLSAFAQNGVEMADGLRSSGKIYIVVGVVLIIFAGIVIYLISLDKKIGKLEKDLDEIDKEKFRP